MRPALLITALFVLAVLAFCEVGLAYPVAGWLYLLVVVAIAAALLRSSPIRTQAARLAVLVVLVSAVVALYLVKWTPRKPFLQDLGRIRVGMAESEVMAIMGHYMQGTGWPASPLGSPGAQGTLTDVGSGARYSTDRSQSGELVIRDALVFRHSNDGRFNSDWGIVSFADGRVVSVEFSPD